MAAQHLLSNPWYAMPGDMQSSSGSGAWSDQEWNQADDSFTSSWAFQAEESYDSYQQEETYSYQNTPVTEDEFLVYSASDVYGSDLRPGEVMNHKTPPAFDGHMSWFMYEELVLDWLDLCSLDEKKRGPALKARLIGEAAIFKPMLDREQLIDENNGVQYLLDTLRPKFIKGAQNVFLFRLLQFLKYKRGKLEMNRWLAK